MTDEELKELVHQSLVNAVDENGYTDNLTADPALVAQEMCDQIQELEGLEMEQFVRVIEHVTTWQEIRHAQSQKE